MRICIWGDSIANGYNDFEKGGWVERLNLRFWNTLEYKGPNVMNLGISGDTSADMVIVGLTPVIDSMLQPFPWSDSGKCYATKYVKEYNGALESLATKVGVDYISLFDEVKETELPDGLHPDEKAHERIAEKVHAALLQKLPN
ncbi:hypothetical protein CL652_02660 [bacterium]|nr:hypothetical protein [bacterium]|tara:strand:+ start:10811 stop:11239 length:429 start_codon:yes stop_codon:yes gene_type:complete